MEPSLAGLARGEPGVCAEVGDGLLEDGVVDRVALVAEHEVAEVVGEVVLVGQEQPHDGGVVLVGDAGIGVLVGQVSLVELLHQVADLVVEVAEALALVALTLDLIIARLDAVAGFELAPDVEVEPHIHALVAQALDPPVQPVHRLRVEVAGVIELLVDDGGANPAGGVMVVNPHEVVAELGDTPGLFADLFFAREDGICRDVPTPEPRRRAVAEDQPVPVGADGPQCPGGLVIQEAKVNGRAIPEQRVGVPCRHIDRPVALGQGLRNGRARGEGDGHGNGRHPGGNIGADEEGADLLRIAALEVGARGGRVEGDLDSLIVGNRPAPATTVG